MVKRGQNKTLLKARETWETGGDYAQPSIMFFQSIAFQKTLVLFRKKNWLDCQPRHY